MAGRRRIRLLVAGALFLMAVSVFGCGKKEEEAEVEEPVRTQVDAAGGSGDVPPVLDGSVSGSMDGSELVSGTWTLSGVRLNGTVYELEALEAMGMSKEELDTVLLFQEDGSGASYSSTGDDHDMFTWTVRESEGKTIVSVLIDGEQEATDVVLEDGLLVLSYDAQELGGDENVTEFAMLMSRKAEDSAAAQEAVTTE